MLQITINALTVILVGLATFQAHAMDVELSRQKPTTNIKFNEMINNTASSREELRQEINEILVGERRPGGYDLVDFYESEISWDDQKEVIGSTTK